MKLIIEWFTSGKPQFNLSISSKEGNEPFLVVKGCRLVSGAKGDFVSWPATKKESTGRYWQHVWASEAFANAVLAEALKSKPRDEPEPRRRSDPVDDRDVPF